MKAAYSAYKEWWLINEWPSSIGSLYFEIDQEQAFEQHINDLGLYNLMEKLCLWSEE
jgi:hypothetical protein